MTQHSVRDIQARVNSMAVDGSTVLNVDGMNGPNTRAQISLALKAFGLGSISDMFDSDGINRIHWHWAGSGYNIGWDTVKHYNGFFDHEGNEYDGGAPPQQQAFYIPGKVGVSHTRNANTGAVGLSISGMTDSEVNWGTGKVNQGTYPITWAAVDAMLEKTAELCRRFEIIPSPWTTLTHAEVQSNLNIKQRGKWDIRVMPESDELLSPWVAGSQLRKRMMEKFW